MYIKEICKVKSSKRVLTKDFKKEGIPFLRGSDFINWKNKNKNQFNFFISKEHFNKLIKITGKPKKGDLFITGDGTIGNVFYLKEQIDFYFKDGVIWLKDFKKNINSKFVYYYLETPKNKNKLISLSIGSVIPHLTTEVVRNAFIKDFTLKAQQHIVNII
ncbi:restriction endonuclease subunit S [[Mycoplasma] falconis]|nr:restriction endonuclease subunit S [[Mycoplasma] falconis]